ncbi:MAG: hypothetical protein F6K03_02930, partial [Kamptonema sp. SIO4C4]|nr:hypothetical protein [Kamptonema sp. SIO4C4]
MVKSLQKIEQDLAGLTDNVVQLKEQIEQQYARYLNHLGESVQRSVILTSYQICTQTYPELFLQLAFNERQSLQQKIRQLGRSLAEELPQVLEQARLSQEDARQSSSGEAGANQVLSKLPITPEQLKMIREQLFQKMAEQQQKAEADQQESADASESTDLPNELIAATEEDSDPTNELQEMLVQVEAEAEDASDIEDDETEEEDEEDEDTTDEVNPDPNHPGRLLQEFKQAEALIVEMLQNLSNQTNHLLQSVGILPKKLPPKLLEAAIEAENSPGNAAGSPNQLNLLIEAENEKAPKESSVMQVTAIRLRLAEIEFAQPKLGFTH